MPLQEAFLEVRRLNKALKSVVIVGDPGSGKTTWLKHMLLPCVDEGSAALGLPSPAPSPQPFDWAATAGGRGSRTT